MQEIPRATAEPTVMVIFGATGDLAQKKLYPSIFDLYRKNLLPKKFAIVAFGRRGFSQSEYRSFVRGCLRQESADTMESFLESIEYTQGIFDDADSYSRLANVLTAKDGLFNVCANKLFYLAVPPTLYEGILHKLSRSGLTIPCGGRGGWTRVLIEKPFGRDFEHARKLDRLLGKLFKETQIFRIDHYLAKETLQNILAFRFSNSLFEPLWNKKHIEKIAIRMHEKGGIGSRGVFYDGVGALRDAGQNHLLAMLSLVIMEYPKDFSVQAIRRERASAIKRLVPVKGAALRKIKLGQYDGYQREEHVSEQSNTETFFRMTAELSGARWGGVPVEFSSGKGLYESRTEIVIDFRDVRMKHKDVRTSKNKLIFRVQPDEGISVTLHVKTPGFETYAVHPQALSFRYADSDLTKETPDAYERVLYDCIRGDQTLFASTQEMEAQWKFITPILTWAKNNTPVGYTLGAHPETI